MKVKITYLPTQNEVNELDLFAATVPKGECIIGRSPDCDLSLESPDVSRVHGKFFVQDGKYYYCDTGSRNGSIINNILAEKNLPYILNHKDSIQIGDYVLMVEDIKPLPEQLPETVFRVIDPALFSRPVFENVNVANITNVEPEAVSELSGEVISPPTQEEVPAPEVIYAAYSENEEVITAPENQIVEEKIFVQSQDIAGQLQAIVPDMVTNNCDEEVDLSTPILEELTTVQPQDLNISPSVTDTYEEVDLDISAPILEELTTVQPQDLNISPSVTDTYEEVDLDISAPILEELTTVQPHDLNISPSVTDTYEEVDLDISAPILEELTIVQPQDLNISPSVTDTYEEVDLDDGGEEESLEVVREVHPEATTDIATVTEETFIERSDTVSQPEELVSNVDSEAPESVSDALNESQAEVIIAPVPNIDSQAEVTEVFSNEEVDFSSTSLEELTAADSVSTVENLEINASISTAEVGEELTAADTLFASENLEIDASISTTEVGDTPEPVSQILEAVSKAEEVPDIDNVEANTESEASQMNIQKNIVLIAHESNKSELADLVAQHQEFFSQSVTISWPSVSEVLKQQAGIAVSEEIPPPTSGGYQKINLLLNAGDILAVIFLRDFLTTQAGQANEEAFLRICNINQVLVATNFKTAEAIVHYLKHVSH
ncbi:FHA domain-containing protein [Cuspidothrix issatschenkoi LEGE 03284]|uniref:FHA domain-containing protein n=1 Tax=Cuspidothrix issatschenkoi TaxID=230752 RepID=UPI00187FC666|nr:FHA domain-containing protein [Cuspidothrix issatschenkoi]MBE9232512.1 FHA domain-containing protein [Cuspidothrix issatschenkoi LEGE 03284]